MNQLQLTIPWNDFRAKLLNFIEQAKQLHCAVVKTADELANFNNRFKDWDDEVVNCFEESFNEKYNQYVSEFHNVHSNNFNIPGHSILLETQIRQAKDSIIHKLEYLIFNERFLNACDAVVRPESVDLGKRKAFTIKQKQQLLLEKLFMLYDDHHYPVGELLSGNGVVFKRINEPDELVEVLANQGLVDVEGFLGGDRTAQLTTEGVSYMEEITPPVQENYDDIRYSYAEMSAKLDAIKEELNKNNLGHEILFDELQELKELYTTLNKKNWGQLLKGKLVDIAIGKLVDNATLALIYEAITHHKFNLLV